METLKKIKAWSIAILISIASIHSVSATHLVGGEITYEWVTGNTYMVTMNLFTDCSGINPPQAINVNYRSDNCSIYLNKSLAITGPAIQVSPLCVSSIPNSTCNGGILYGVQKVSYQDTINLPTECNDWKFSYFECCRNNAITNLDMPGNSGFYVAAHLDNLNFPFNNSAAFGSLPITVTNAGTTTQLNWNTYDVDGDSLTYELVPAREFNFGPVNLNYAAGYTYDQPFLASTPSVLDPSTGILTVTPSMVQSSVVSMLVTEYRGGIEIGKVYRDVQVTVINGSNNLPTLSGINGTSNFTINGCPGDTITFDVLSNDLDTGSIISISMGQNGTNALFNTGSGNMPTGTFTWIPDTSDVSGQPYVITLTVADDNCPYTGTNTYAYFVYVNGCNTNDVWPGDANSDGVANLYDLLPIGLAYSETGPVRSNASLAWIPQPATDWTGSLNSGINYKHADTDGNGVVNISDTTAIGVNFGLNHPLRNPTPPSLASSNLIVSASQDTVPVNTSVDLTISLDSPSDSIYGLAFRVSFSPIYIIAGSVSFDFSSSIFGTSGAMVHMEKVDYVNGYAEIAVTGINHVDRLSNGPVLVMSIVTTDNVSGKVSLNVILSDIESNDNDGDPLSITASGTTITIDPSLSSIDNINPDNMSVYPTTDHQLVYNYTGSGNLEKLELFDMQGKSTFNEVVGTNSGIFNTSHLNTGIYICRFTINGKTFNQKIKIF